MPCGSCGGRRQSTTQNATKYEVTYTNGTKKTVSSEVEANSIVARNPGAKYKAVTR